MSSTTVGTLIGTYVQDIGTILTANLPAILVVAGAIFGLVLIVRLAKRFLAGR